MASGGQERLQPEGLDFYNQGVTFQGAWGLGLHAADLCQVMLNQKLKIPANLRI